MVDSAAVRCDLPPTLYSLLNMFLSNHLVDHFRRSWSLAMQLSLSPTAFQSLFMFGP